jgi:hypothetical protein
MRINSIFLLLASIFFSLDSQAFLWGDKSFDECIVSRMKGVDSNQYQNVENICYEKFPVLRKFKNINHYGELSCDYNGKMHQLQISKDYISRFKITKRNSKMILAEDKDWKLIDENGVIFELSIETGIATIGATARQSRVSLSCREN